MGIYTGIVDSEFTQIIHYDVDDNPIYICEAIPGTSSASNTWRIKKITYDANDNATNIQFAEGSREFKYVADNYASYTYS